MLVKCPSLADGENELHQRLVYIVMIRLLSFSPKQVFLLKELQAVLRYAHGKINVAKDFLCIESRKIVFPQSVLNLLLAGMNIITHTRRLIINSNLLSPRGIYGDIADVQQTVVINGGAVSGSSAGLGFIIGSDRLSFATSKCAEERQE